MEVVGEEDVVAVVAMEGVAEAAMREVEDTVVQVEEVMGVVAEAMGVAHLLVVVAAVVREFVTPGRKEVANLAINADSLMKANQERAVGEEEGMVVEVEVEEDMVVEVSKLNSYCVSLEVLTLFIS